MKGYAKTGILFFVLIFFLLSLGCTQTIVPLDYEPVSVASLKCRKKLTVTPFVDDRTQTRTIGTTRKGYSFYSESYVEDWFTRSLIRQIEAQGCPVESARKGESLETPVVHGRILQAILRERSRTKYEAALKMTLMLKQGLKNIHEETFSVKLEKTVLPTGDTPRKILLEAMQSLMGRAVPKLIAASNE
ncbi:MAG: hypothetical protein K9K64_15910 [Desulfohalobiaceae bacterium]|nr:hypothetical protein [Desulfohalobiaceae bacterium]